MEMAALLETDFETHRLRSHARDRCSNLGLQTSTSRSSQSRVETDVGKLQRTRKVRVAPTQGPIARRGELYRPDAECLTASYGSQDRPVNRMLEDPDRERTKKSYLQSLCGLVSWSWRHCSRLTLRPTAGTWTDHHSLRSLAGNRRSNLGLRTSTSRSSQSRVETDVGKLQRTRKVRVAPTRGPIARRGELDRPDAEGTFASCGSQDRPFNGWLEAPDRGRTKKGSDFF
ncbi:uncharacterized protein LOC144607144 isoform X2 [Rhinoraja longicauda]